MMKLPRIRMLSLHPPFYYSPCRYFARAGDLDAILTKIPSLSENKSSKINSGMNTNNNKSVISGYISAYYKASGYENLMSIIDPINNSSQLFHPAAIRSFKLFKSQLDLPENESKYNKDIIMIHKETEKVLLHLNLRMHKIHNLAPMIEKLGNTSFRIAISILKKPDVKISSEELDVICTGILVGRVIDKAMWEILDNCMIKVVQNQSFYLDQLFLPAYIFQNIKQKIVLMKFTSFKTTEYVRTRIIQEIQDKGENIFENESINDGLVNYQHIGEGKTFQNKSIERLSLFLSILSIKPGDFALDNGIILLSKNESSEAEGGTDFQRRINYHIESISRGILDSCGAPTKLLSLKYIWECLPKLKLRSSYLLQKSFFDQVYASLLADPSQLMNQEEAIQSLLSTMVSLNYKHAGIIDILFKEVSVHGSIQSTFLLNVFNSFIELGAEGPATKILNKIIANANLNSTANTMFATNRFAVLDLSPKAKDQLFYILRDKKEEYTHLDLIIGLRCFSKDSTKLQYRQFCMIEESITKRIPTLLLEDVLLVFHSYGSIGRKYPDMIFALDQYIGANINALQYHQLVRLLWAGARLYHKSSYFDMAIMKLLAQKPPFPSQEMAVFVTQLLWSLSVLDELTLERFQKLEIYLETSQYKHRNLNFITNQLGQAVLDLILNMRLKNLDSTEIYQKWKHILGRKTTAFNQGSSYYHHDISMALKGLGIKHINEKVVEYGLLVDIYIPNDDKYNQGKSDYKGLVIEVDGPVHYESYLMEPLGPTVMKRRHLRILGYEVISIPCTEYKEVFKTSSMENKAAYLKNVLKRSIVLSKSAS